MTATAQSGASALLIANNEDGVTDKSFKTSVELDPATAKKTLAPVSSIDGVNFYFTNGDNVDGIGDAIKEQYTLYSESANFPSGASPYIEYDLLLKATLSPSADNAPIPINLTELKLAYDNGAQEKDEENAFRIAFFASPAVESVTNATDATTTLVAIMNSQNETKNFTRETVTVDERSVTQNWAVYKTTGTADDSALKPVQKNDPVVDKAQVDNNVETGKNVYYRVIVRLWIEGEDITCTNSVFSPLAGSWMCSLKFATTGDAVANYTADGDQPGGTKA